MSASKGADSRISPTRPGRTLGRHATSDEGNYVTPLYAYIDSSGPDSSFDPCTHMSCPQLDRFGGMHMSRQERAEQKGGGSLITLVTFCEQGHMLSRTGRIGVVSQRMHSVGDQTCM